MPASGSTARRHIAIFVPDLRGAGAERVALRLANGIAERGHEVDLLVAASDGAFSEDVGDGVTLIDLGASRVLACVPALRRYLRDRRPDVLLSHIFHANVVAILARWAARTTTRVVVVEHNTYSVKQQTAGGTDRWFATPAMRATYRFADVRVGVSGGVADDLRSVLGPSVEPVISLPNPVITPEFLAATSADISAEMPRLSGDGFLLGMGRLTAQKRFDRLIRAYAAADPDVDLVIIGEGEDRDALLRLIADLGLDGRVHLPGFTDHPAAWLHQATGFVLSSDFEGLPTVLIEALAVGTPIVSTDCPSGPREILMPEGDSGEALGLLVPPDDVAALAAGITDLASGNVPTHPETAGRYTVDTVVEAYLAVLLAD